jgi:molecular chaperone GrpE
MNSEPDRPAKEAPAAVEDTGETTSSGSEDPLAEAVARAEENWDRYVRAAAELENVRKRAARDVENAHKFALERFATDLLSVCDSLEMALDIGDEASAESLKEGSEATLKLLGSVLQRFGIEEVDPVGEPFDPSLHEAMTMQPSADAEPGSVLTVFQKGYALNGRLLRPARVVVAAEPAAASESAEQE